MPIKNAKQLVLQVFMEGLTAYQVMSPVEFVADLVESIVPEKEDCSRWGWYDWGYIISQWRVPGNPWMPALTDTDQITLSTRNAARIMTYFKNMYGKSHPLLVWWVAVELLLKEQMDPVTRDDYSSAHGIEAVAA